MHDHDAKRKAPWGTGPFYRMNILWGTVRLNNFVVGQKFHEPRWAFEFHSNNSKFVRAGILRPPDIRGWRSLSARSGSTRHPQNPKRRPGPPTQKRKPTS